MTHCTRTRPRFLQSSPRTPPSPSIDQYVSCLKSAPSGIRTIIPGPMQQARVGCDVIRDCPRLSVPHTCSTRTSSMDVETNFRGWLEHSPDLALRRSPCPVLACHYLSSPDKRAPGPQIHRLFLSWAMGKALKYPVVATWGCSHNEVRELTLAHVQSYISIGSPSFVKAAVPSSSTI